MSALLDLNCPKCQGKIPLADVNVGKDLVLCRNCNSTFTFSEIVRGEQYEEEDDNNTEPLDLGRPPEGTWFHRTPQGFELGASTRSRIALFLVPFMCLWSGGSLGGIYGSQIAKGQFNPILSLFGIPFLIGTVVIGAFTLMTLCGKIRVRAFDQRGEIFAGVGPLGFRKQFKWEDIKSIRRLVRIGSKGNRYEQICLDMEPPITFATGLTKPRMDFFFRALRQLRRDFPAAAPPMPKAA